MAQATTATPPVTNIDQIVSDVLATIDQEREREIIARRFGLYDRRETLEQIGDLLGITRERVRQLEKATLNKLKSGADQLPHLSDTEATFVDMLESLGRAARLDQLSKSLTNADDDRTQAHVHLMASLSPRLVVIDENDKFHHSVAVAEHHDEKTIKAKVEELVKTIKGIGEPKSIEDIHTATDHDDPLHTKAYAYLSKHLTSLRGMWGFIKWPEVNPKNIRDKIYVVLRDSGKPMHFSDIATTIQESDLKRSDVTQQAIHNELIKDKRFILIGRGIYALKEWGYKKGTVADAIEDVLTKEGDPLHRDEIVKRVLEKRQVKETTIILNLQSKPQFKRVAKATYTMAATDDEAA